MDCNKIGTLILKLRKEKGMSQKELANILNISDKTVSKDFTQYKNTLDPPATGGHTIKLPKGMAVTIRWR